MLRTFEIQTVCDVGSMDGSDALLFRGMLPRARIFALEANPRNFAIMETNEELRRQSIRILPVAASDRDSEAPFFVAKADYTAGRDRFRRGMSSLRKRSDDSLLAEVVQVRTARLDKLLSEHAPDHGPIAVWIDAEGMAFEVICGATGVLGSTGMLHVEVETKTIIGADQKLFADVERVLRDAGFAVLATDQPLDSLQLNALFVRADLLRSKTREIRFWTTVARIRHAAALTVARLLPQRLWPMIGIAPVMTGRGMKRRRP